MIHYVQIWKDTYLDSSDVYFYWILDVEEDTKLNITLLQIIGKDGKKAIVSRKSAYAILGAVSQRDFDVNFIRQSSKNFQSR